MNGVSLSVMRAFSFLLAALFAGLLLSGCNMMKSAGRTVKKAVDWIPVPSIPLPSFSSMKRVIPGMDRNDRVNGDDPTVPFSPDVALAPGHTLRLKVFSGTRKAEEQFEGLVVINENGVADFDEFGKARLGGLSVLDARRAMERLFRSGGFTADTLHVHIVSIENTKLVFIEGDVLHSRVLPFAKRLKVTDCILAAGGRPQHSMARSVYVTQRGQRKFYRSEAVANEEAELEPGDVIFLSPDL